MSRDSLPQSDWHTATPPPGYAALRHHRWSAVGAEYFVTINLQRPASGLAADPLLPALRAQIDRHEAEHIWTTRTWVVMPDHLHLLFTLGNSVALADSIRLFKGRLTPALRRASLHWQDGYYEHRLRPNEDRLPIFLYIFLNPCRAKLLPLSEKWPAYFCHHEDWIWFEPLTNSSTPVPAWLA